MSRKFAFLFDDGQRYHSVCQLIDETTCRDHFAAGLNGGNGEVIANLLDSLIEGKLVNLTEDDRIKALWEKAGYKVDHLTPGAMAIVATGRSFNIAHKSGLPSSQSKVFGEVPMALKALIWDFIGNGARHLNEKEIGETKKSSSIDSLTKQLGVIENTPSTPSIPIKTKKSRTRKTIKQEDNSTEVNQAI